jgi:hypothetical protein
VAEIELRIGTEVNLFENPEMHEDFAGIISLVIYEEKNVNGEQECKVTFVM